MSITKNMMKKLGEKVANASINPRCWPYVAYQPKMPAKIQAKMQESK